MRLGHLILTFLGRWIRTRFANLLDCFIYLFNFIFLGVISHQKRQSLLEATVIGASNLPYPNPAMAMRSSRPHGASHSCACKADTRVLFRRLKRVTFNLDLSYDNLEETFGGRRPTHSRLSGHCCSLGAVLLKLMSSSPACLWAAVI